MSTNELNQIQDQQAQHLEQVEPTSNIDTIEDDGARLLTVRRAVAAGGLLVSAGFVGLAVEGYTPHPSVNVSSSHMMIEVNDGLRGAGESALLIGGMSFAAGYIARRTNRHFDAMLKSTDSNKLMRAANLGLTMMLMGTSAAGAALGDAAAEGASRPVDAIASGLSPQSPDSTIFMTQHEHALPFDHSEVSLDMVAKLNQEVAARGGKVMPYSFILGDARHMTGNANPSSAAVVLLPNAVIKSKYGVSLDAPSNPADISLPKDCSNNSVIINKQFATKTTSVNAHGAEIPQMQSATNQYEDVIVEGKPVHVAAINNDYPGLDRSEVIGSLEEMAGCITSKDIVTGAAISGIDKHDLQDLLNRLEIPYNLDTYEEYKKEYADFWDKSVKPPEMQLVFYTWLATLVGLSAMKVSDVLMRRHYLADQYSRGTSSLTMTSAEFLRAGAESVKAGVLAAIPTCGAVALNASSQYGIAERFDEQTLGAGFVTGVSASAIGAVVGSLYIAKMNYADAERSI